MAARRANRVELTLRGERLLLRSEFEAAVARQLAEAGLYFKHEPRDYRLDYRIEGVYVPDFWVPGRRLYVEAKGWFPPEDRRKLAAVKRCNPSVDLRIVFQNAFRKLSSARNSLTYAAWAEKHGIPWAHRVVPEEWVK